MLLLPHMKSSPSLKKRWIKVVVEWWNIDHKKLDCHMMIVGALYSLRSLISKQICLTNPFERSEV